MVGEQSNPFVTLRDTRPGAVALSYGLLRQLVDVPVRKCLSTIARYQMEACRREPAPLVEKLRAARSLLFVCHGNIIRSTFAAHVLQHVLGSTTGIAVMSAGVEAVRGQPAHPCAMRLAEALHVDMRSHTASRLSPEHVQIADVIFAADLLQLTAIRRRFPEARDKTFLLACLAPLTPLEIADPVNGDDEVFAKCFIHILDAVHPIARAVTMGSIRH
jgi:protein-tyrosine-phosphatase